MTSEATGGPAASDDAPAALPRLSAERYDSFVVRVLSHGRGSLIHGQVTHVATRRSLRFTDPQRVIGFILAQLGRRANDSPPDAVDEPLEDIEL